VHAHGCLSPGSQEGGPVRPPGSVAAIVLKFSHPPYLPPMPGGSRMTSATADQTFREVMTVEPPATATPLAQATREFVFGQLWPRPGLSRRDRRGVPPPRAAAPAGPPPADDPA